MTELSPNHKSDRTGNSSAKFTDGNLKLPHIYFPKLIITVF
jgi:hypothetical protein